ncbi:MAG: Trm112 family protein [Alphaproteobacteria bacterium]|nr:Trm112 family protein [Alphaproteobacteria bacterium]
MTPDADKSAAAEHAESQKETAGVDRRLLEILVCPVTKGPLDYKPETQELLSYRADLAFPIRDGVPLMTVEAARSLTEQERSRAKSRGAPGNT